MRLTPITLRAACALITAAHRHNKAPRGHRYSIGLHAQHDLFGEEILVGVVVVGRPVARHLDDGVTAEVTRLCTLDGAPLGACSKLYRAAWRSWHEMGGQRMITYTLRSESGASLRGAGWVREAEIDGQPGGWMNRDGRDDQAVIGEPKVRWVCRVR